MLCNYYTCSSCYKGRERAYVESLYPISSSAAVIYYPAIDIWIYSDAVSSQRNCKIGYLLWSFSFHLHAHQQCSNLSLCSLASRIFIDHIIYHMPLQVLPLKQLFYSLLYHSVTPFSRKFLTISNPCSVRMDSGWNWTPSIGNSLCLIPII